ncbi:MAG: UMP kinase [Erysipelotrichaceae bacterium]|jgi:uridylate kinase|nr:UMP kinase [Erysipelotrichaceae bacterium]MBQ1523396.1 UMP kinase [Erysipelotrichaceae bacterium]MBR2544563.1 UMP kinase [Erysipelotrichaceae bacterium]MBR2700708.1 UMP kinase [Erysipelotrichaceae bacterium]
MYKRVLLKLSGEALSAPDNAYNPELLKSLAEEMKEVLAMGVQVGIVVGGGNIIRGKFASQLGLPRVQADKMGMLATLINALAVQGALEINGVPAYVQTAFEAPKAADVADARKAIQHLEAGEVVIFGGGTGNPFFSTDTGAALRASEIEAEVILMAKNGVDGVYTDDPRKNPDAKKYDKLTFKEVLDKNLGVIDQTAASMCLENNIKGIVFNMNDIANISRACMGENIGTLITGGE